MSRFEGGGQQTKIDERGGQHPVWDDEFRFNVVDNGEAKRFIKFSIFTKESRIDDLIGEAQLDIMEHDILRKGEFDGMSISLRCEELQEADEIRGQTGSH